MRFALLDVLARFGGNIVTPSPECVADDWEKKSEEIHLGTIESC